MVLVQKLGLVIPNLHEVDINGPSCVLGRSVLGKCVLVDKANLINCMVDLMVPNCNISEECRPKINPLGSEAQFMWS